ncbi:MAG: glycosyltransferase family 2 protein [Bacteroidia bacterium]
MIVEGFAIARNVLRADYPIQESLESIAPLCSRISVAVGQSDDGTLEFLQNLKHLSLNLHQTQWDETLRTGGRVLAEETNKAKSLVSPEADWLIYIQADECLHQDDYSLLQAAMRHYQDREEIDALLLNYRHFYGSYAFEGDSRRWYRKEIRIIKNRPAIFSWKDAQGFRKLPAQKLRVAEVNATVFHYGWVKNPVQQQIKQNQFHRLWHSDTEVAKRVGSQAQFDYSEIDSLQLFSGTHPAVMEKRMARMDWEFTAPLGRKNMNLKDRVLHGFEKMTGIRVGEYRNYIRVDRFQP